MARPIRKVLDRVVVKRARKNIKHNFGTGLLQYLKKKRAFARQRLPSAK